MPDPNEKYSYIDNVSEEECYEKWEGNDWVADDNNPEVGVCESNFDFDAWAAEHVRVASRREGEE